MAGVFLRAKNITQTDTESGKLMRKWLGKMSYYIDNRLKSLYKPELEVLKNNEGIVEDFACK